MKLCRYQPLASPDLAPRWGLVNGDTLQPLPDTGVATLMDCLARREELQGLATAPSPAPLSLAAVRLLAPLDHQEVWAAGVTYERSRAARMDESDFSASAYDRVYEAERPELFFKSLPDQVSGPGDPVGIRADSRWSVPEPELAIVINPAGKVVAATIGNDLSARDLEGENLLYLPQAKIYRHACALGPWLVVGRSEKEIRGWSIRLEIRRNQQVVFEGNTSLDRLRRSFDELAAYLCRSRDLPHGAILLTGAGIVPPDDFTLRAGDSVTIAVDGIGDLTNPVVVV